MDRCSWLDASREKEDHAAEKTTWEKLRPSRLRRYWSKLSRCRQNNTPEHSNAIVVVDKDGNIAAVTHSINTVIWGDTGIVVDGVPIPDSAGFQQETLAGIKPGDRVPHQIIDTITFDGDTPVLATGSIGFSLQSESIRVLLGVLGQHHDLATMMVAPPLLRTGDAGRIESIPQGDYQPDFIAKLKAIGLNVKEVPAETAAGLRGHSCGGGN